jgi:hypothetical protein
MPSSEEVAHANLGRDCNRGWAIELPLPDFLELRAAS